MMLFFFQAEDGIRDVAVTGVQTCALPICSSPNLLALACSDASATSSSVAMAAAADSGLALNVPAWATRWLRSQSGSPRKVSMDISSRLPQSEIGRAHV